MRLVVESPRDDGLLALLLGSTGLRLALDLRDESWDGVDVAPAVRVNDWEAEAPFSYLRFREPPYTEEELPALARRIRPLVAAEVDVFAYFRHEDAPDAPATPPGCSSSSAGRTTDRSRGGREQERRLHRVNSCLRCSQPSP